MRALSEFTTAELVKCEELSAALLALRECLPERLAVYLDTFNSDLEMEREDRARAEEEARARVRAALAAGRTPRAGHGDTGNAGQATAPASVRTTSP